MESQVRSVGSHWPWLIAGAMSVSASTALAPRPQAAPPAPSPAAASLPAETHVEPEGGGRWLGGATHALELLADHLGVDTAYRENAKAARALNAHLSEPGSAGPATALRKLIALDLSKDAGAQRHRDALVRHLEAKDYGRWLLDTVKRRAGDKRVQFVIALMPDYVDSNSAWMFDSYLDAVQRAAGAAGFVLDRFHLPDWAPERSLESGVADQRAHEEEPGAILFRNARPPGASQKDVDLLVVLIPTETATSGLHPAAFLSAAALVSDWSPEQPLLVLGPSFSGSTPSLVRVLNEAKSQDLLPKCIVTGPLLRIVAGSASARGNQLLLQEQTGLDAGAVEFHSTSVSDQDYLVALRDYLGRIDEDWRVGEGMALLVEGNTGWGQGLLVDGRPGEKDREGKEVKEARAGALPVVNRDCRAGKRVFPCAHQLRFPLHISRLRGAAAARGRTSAAAEGLSSVVSLELEERVPPTDQIPSLTPGSTAATVETTMASLLDSLDRLHVSAVGIYATDKRDHLFLAQEITRRSPNVLLFALESSLIYLHPDFRAYLRGTLVASPSPLFNLTQVLAGRPNARRLLQFPNSDAATVYNAFLVLLDHPDRMLDYGSLCGRVGPGVENTLAAQLANCAPSVWLGVVGQEDIWPLARVDPIPSVNQGYSWPGRDGALYKPHPPFTESPTVRADWPHPTLFLLVGVALVLFLHGLIAVGILCDLAGRPWLRRLLPVLEPPHNRAQRVPPAKPPSAKLIGTVEGQNSRETVLRQEYWLSILACAGALWVVTVWLGGVAEAGSGTLDAGTVVAATLIDAVRWLGTGGRRDVLGVGIALGALLALWPTAARRGAGVGSLTLLRVVPVAAGLFCLLQVRAIFLEPGSAWVGALRGLNALRAASLGSFVSPTPAVLLLAAAAYAWGFWNLRRLHLQFAEFRPGSPVLALLTGGHPSVKEEFLEALNHPGLRIGSAPSIALVLFVAVPLALASRLGHSIDGRSMGIFVLWGTTLAVFLMGHTLAHSARLGRSLLSTLRSLNLHPIGSGFARVAREPFLWRPSLNVPDGRMLDPLVRQAGAVVLALRRLQRQIPAETVALAHSPSYGIVEEDHRDPRAHVKAADEACRVVACGLHIRADDVHGIIDVELVDKETLARDVCSHDPFQATATWARLESFAGPLSLALQRGPWACSPYPGEPQDKPDWQREAETFLALQLAYGLRHVLVRLLSGLTIALFGLGLILAAHLFYVFQGRAFWLTMDWLNLGLATGLALVLLVKLEKDAVLSRLWSTTPGRVDWSGAFVQRMLVYGALPVVTLFATFFPEVGQSIFAWLEPVKKALP